MIGIEGLPRRDERMNMGWRVFGVGPAVSFPARTGTEYLPEVPAPNYRHGNTRSVESTGEGVLPCVAGREAAHTTVHHTAV